MNINNNLRQVSKNKKHKVDPSIEPIFPDFTKELSKQESKKKSKDRKAGFLVDNRKIYPPFKRDKDNFFLCDYTNPETGEPCDAFFGQAKSINAHWSRIHNKDQNPNRLRKMEKEGKMILEMEKVFSRFMTMIETPLFKQTLLLDEGILMPENIHKRNMLLGKSFLVIPSYTQSSLFDF